MVVSWLIQSQSRFIYFKIVNNVFWMHKDIDSNDETNAHIAFLPRNLLSLCPPPEVTAVVDLVSSTQQAHSHIHVIEILCVHTYTHTYIGARHGQARYMVKSRDCLSSGLQFACLWPPG